MHNKRLVRRQKQFKYLILIRDVLYFTVLYIIMFWKYSSQPHVAKTARVPDVHHKSENSSRVSWAIVICGTLVLAHKRIQTGGPAYA